MPLPFPSLRNRSAWFERRPQVEQLAPSSSLSSLIHRGQVPIPGTGFTNNRKTQTMASTATSTTGRDTPDTDSGTVCYEFESNEARFLGLIRAIVEFLQLGISTTDLDNLLAHVAKCAEVAELKEHGLSGDPKTSGLDEDEILKRVTEAVEQWDAGRDELERMDWGFFRAAKVERNRERLAFVVKRALSLAGRTHDRQDANYPVLEKPARTAALKGFHIGNFNIASSSSQDWERRVQVPSPGKSFMITDRTCEHALSLQSGNLKLIGLANANNFGTAGCWVWECVENNGWLGFKNWASGTYLGHNGSQIMWAERKHHKGHEQFCVRQVDGGYVLLMESWGKLGKVAAVDEKRDPKWKVVLEGKPVVWNFVKV